MKCYKCESSISNIDKYCPRCGTLFDNGDVERITDTIENRLLNIYINKKRFISNISLGYLFFNFWYALYKKMYFEAIVGAIADAILFTIILNWQNFLFESLGFNALLIIFLLIIAVVVNIYYILKFDEIYIGRNKKYIAKLIEKYGSNDVELLIDKCEKDSKGNLVIAILPIMMVVAILIFLIFIY